MFSRVRPFNLPKDIEVMIIGDTPTVMEIRKGTFLTGPAPKILKQTMDKVGMKIPADKIWWTTALKCAHPKRKGKQIPKDPIVNCHPNIIQEIQAINPKMILILGKTAMQVVYNNLNVKVKEVTGRVTPIPGISEDIIAIPLLHPALIIRSPGDYKPFLASMQLAANIYNGGKPYDTGEVKYQVLDTEAKCTAAIKYLGQMSQTYLSADMETTDLDYRKAEFLVMGIGFVKNKVFVIPREMRHRVKDFFAIPNKKWIWQHGKYDTKVMWRRQIAAVPLDHDVMYMHYTLDETSEHNLEYLSKVFLQAEAYKYKMNQNFKAITLENYESWFDALAERVAVDCDMTYQLHTVLLNLLSEEEKLNRLYHDLLMPAAKFLSRVEQNGLLVNPVLLNEYGRKYEKQLENIMHNIESLAAPYWDRNIYMEEMGAKSAPDRFNPGSPKQMSWMVFNKLHLKPRIRKGKSTAKDVLASIEPSNPIIDEVLHYRKVQKEYSTYITGLLKRRDIDGRVRSNFSLQVTATGRLSSKEPNVQNIPSAFGVGNVRRAFLAPRGYIIMESDYSGAELRWLACLSKCPVLTKVFVEGRNLHDETSLGIWGPKFTKQDRMRAKAVNFGIPYGREAQSFADEFNISFTEGQKMVDGWMNTYTGAAKYLLWCANAVTEGYFLETPFGRRRRFGLITPDSLHAVQNEARNFPIQSASSDTTLTAAIELEEDAAAEDAVIVNLIHDSIMFYVPANAETIQRFAKHVHDHMIQVPKRLFGYEVPFESDTDIGFTWGDLYAYDKEANVCRWEEKQPDGTKIAKSMALEEWLVQEAAKVAPVYGEEWYKNLEPVNEGNTTYAG